MIMHRRSRTGAGFSPSLVPPDAKAQFNLGVAYGYGEGVAQNDAEAVKWFRKAAEQGDAGAQFNLGMMYYDGEGVARNYVEAYVWFSLAAGQGMKQAESALNAIESKMTPDQIAEAQQRAVVLKPKSKLACAVLLRPRMIPYHHQIFSVPRPRAPQLGIRGQPRHAPILF
jgi:TPR repeat protein